METCPTNWKQTNKKPASKERWVKFEIAACSVIPHSHRLQPHSMASSRVSGPPPPSWTPARPTFQRTGNPLCLVIPSLPSVSLPPWVLSACFAVPSFAPKASEVRLQEGYSAKSIHRVTVFIPFLAFYPLASNFSVTGRLWPTSPEYQALKGQAGEPHRGRVHGEPSVMFSV